MSEINSDTSKIIWAFGERSKYAHAFPGESGAEAGVALCATRCTPVIRLHHWDISKTEIREITCPVCLKRMKYMNNMCTGEKPNE